MSRTQRTPEESEKPGNSENPVDPLRIPETTSGRSLRTRTPRNHAPNIDNDSDPDDDKPLQLMVTQSPTRNRSSRQRYSDEHISQTPTGSSYAATSSTRSARTHKRPYYAEAEDTDEEESHRSKRSATQGRYVIESDSTF